MKLTLLASFLLLFLINCLSQQLIQLHLKKHARIKKRIELGTPGLSVTKKNDVHAGAIRQLKRDSIYFNNGIVSIKDINRIKFPRTKARMKFDWEEFGYVSLGVGLTTAGLVLAKWKEFPDALTIACSLGYSPYLLRLLRSVSLKKRKFTMGHKYSLRIWDIR